LLPQQSAIPAIRQDWNKGQRNINHQFDKMKKNFIGCSGCYNFFFFQSELQIKTIKQQSNAPVIPETNPARNPIIAKTYFGEAFSSGFIVFYFFEKLWNVGNQKKATINCR
jgi:hypothetical protein